MMHAVERTQVAPAHRHGPSCKKATPSDLWPSMESRAHFLPKHGQFRPTQFCCAQAFRRFNTDLLWPRRSELRAATSDVSILLRSGDLLDSVDWNRCR